MRQHFSWVRSSSRGPKLRRSHAISLPLPLSTSTSRRRTTSKTASSAPCTARSGNLRSRYFWSPNIFPPSTTRPVRRSPRMPIPSVCFRLSPDDAEDMARLFNREHQQFNPVALQNLDVGEAYFHGGHLFIDPDTYTFPRRATVRKQSRRHYGRPRDKVEPIITNKLFSLTSTDTPPNKKNSARPRIRRRAIEP